MASIVKIVRDVVVSGGSGLGSGGFGSIGFLGLLGLGLGKGRKDRWRGRLMGPRLV